jgi:uncharacterized protein YcbX
MLAEHQKTRLWHATAVPTPRVTSLMTTPVKGFALNSRDSVQMDDSGAVGGRGFFMIDEQRELVSITRIGTFASWRAEFDPTSETLTMHSADGQLLESRTPLGQSVIGHFFDDRSVSGNVVGGPWSQWLSDATGRTLTLVRAATAGGAFDVHPVTLLADESVAALGKEAPGGLLDARRFRMLIGFSGVDPYTEDTWDGRLLDIGGAQLRARGPVPRCNATTRDPDSGVRDLKTLQLIEAQRGRLPGDAGGDVYFGIYADVITPGTISLGDEVHVA